MPVARKDVKPHASVITAEVKAKEPEEKSLQETQKEIEKIEKKIEILKKDIGADGTDINSDKEPLQEEGTKKKAPVLPEHDPEEEWP